MLNKLSFNIMNELNESDTNTYKIKKKVLMESNKVEIQELQEEVKSFEDIINEMEYADSYDELRDIASEIVDNQLRKDVLNLIDTCENEEESVSTCYSMVTSDFLDAKRNDLNEAKENQDMNPEKKETLNEKPENTSKEDRLASLKVQLAQDEGQLAPDEKESIEKEIADLEAELFPIDETEESRYKINESVKEKVESKIYEATVSNLKISRHEGNIFMLESANKYIVGENYNESEHLIENAEIYNLEEDANKDYNNRIGLKN